MNLHYRTLLEVSDLMRTKQLSPIELTREMLSPRTRVVCVSLVNFAHGARADVEEIAEICRAGGVWFVVDAVQAPTCAVRESRVRLSPHFYNTEEEIDRVLGCL